MQKELPKIMKDFLVYLTTIKGKSIRTRKEYEYDLTLFFRFLLAVENDVPITEIQSISIKEVDPEFIQKITLEDIYLFQEYCEVQRQNSAPSRARKAATIKSFFKYLKGKRRLLDYNPAEELESPKIAKKHRSIWISMRQYSSSLV